MAGRIVGDEPLRLDQGLSLYQGIAAGQAARDQVLLQHLAGLLECPAETVVVRREPSGKPRLLAPDRPLFFSLAHRGALVVIATAWNGEVGVDLEPLAGGSALDAAVAGSFFSIAEQSWLAGVPAAARGEAFLRLWTAKEAVLKAAGRGIGEGLAEPDLGPVLVAGQGMPEAPCRVAAAGQSWRLRWFLPATVGGPAVVALAEAECTA